MFVLYTKWPSINISKTITARQPWTLLKQFKRNLSKYFGLNKVDRKHLKRRVLNAYSSVKPEHIYRTSFNIKNKYDLSKYLIENEVFNAGGVIAFNKPFGIRRFKTEESDMPCTVTQTLNNPGYVGETSLEEALPLLKEHYNEPNLQVTYFPERWLSGVVICSLNSNTDKKIKKCFKRSKGLQKPHLCYWAVVQGRTSPEAVAERVGIKMDHNEILGNVPIITKSFSKNEVRRHLVKPNIVEHVILSHHPDNDVSLVEVNILHSASHFVRVWLSYCFAPVLGDRLFGGRVRSVLGKKIHVQPKHFSSYQPPEISTKILERLDLKSSQVETIPPHIHLSKVKLEKFSKKEEENVITASPPDHFLWTCTRLSLMVEDDPFRFNLINNDGSSLEDES